MQDQKEYLTQEDSPVRNDAEKDVNLTHVASRETDRNPWFEVGGSSPLNLCKLAQPESIN